MGEIRKRGRVYWIRYYRNGVRIEESAKTDKHEAARKLLQEREGYISKGAPISARSIRLTFKDAAADVLADYAVNGRRSKDHVERRTRLHLTPVFGAKALSAITTADLRAFAADRLKAGASHAEINRELAIVKRAFRLADEGGKYHGRIPKIPMLQERNVRSGFVDDAMITAIVAKLPAALRPVVQFAYVTGWRVQSEILPLEWRHVDGTAGEARLEPGTTKNQAGRVFPVHRRTAHAHRGALDGARGAPEAGNDLPVRVSPSRTAHQELAEGVGGCLHRSGVPGEAPA